MERGARDDHVQPVGLLCFGGEVEDEDWLGRRYKNWNRNMFHYIRPKGPKLFSDVEQGAHPQPIS